MHTICEDAEPVISSNDKIRFPFKDSPENKEIKRINEDKRGVFNRLGFGFFSRPPHYDELGLLLENVSQLSANTPQR